MSTVGRKFLHLQETAKPETSGLMGLMGQEGKAISFTTMQFINRAKKKFLQKLALRRIQNQETVTLITFNNLSGFNLVITKDDKTNEFSYRDFQLSNNVIN